MKAPMSNDNTDVQRKTTVASYAIVAGVSAVLGFVAVYTMKPGAPVLTQAAVAATSAPSAPSDARAEAPSARGNPLATGEMVTYVTKATPEAVPEFKFEDGTGAARTLTDWKGKVVLLNLWATWCAPCKKEMPALDRLQAALGSNKFEVVALSVDRQGANASKKFLDETGAKNLKLYVESTTKSIGTLRANGLPTTLLIDRDGREIGRLAGPAEWDSADAKRLIQSVLK